VAHTATAMSRDASGWRGEERSLDDVEDLDALADDLRDDASETVVLYVEEDDEWLGIVRVSGDAEPKVFLSDRRALETSDLAERIFADALPVLPPPGGDDDEDTPRLQAEAVGDTDLLSDLGTPGDVLLELCAEEGLLPGDVMSALCERAGCLDVLDEIRVA
jgi:putative tRNA adenosine deaminase-associated protein